MFLAWRSLGVLAVSYVHKSVRAIIIVLLKEKQATAIREPSLSEARISATDPPLRYVDTPSEMQDGTNLVSNVSRFCQSWPKSLKVNPMQRFDGGAP